MTMEKEEEEEEKTLNWIGFGSGKKLYRVLMVWQWNMSRFIYAYYEYILHIARDLVVYNIVCDLFHFFLFFLVFFIIRWKIAGFSVGFSHDMAEWWSHRWLSMRCATYIRTDISSTIVMARKFEEWKNWMTSKNGHALVCVSWVFFPAAIVVRTRNYVHRNVVVVYFNGVQ